MYFLNINNNNIKVYVIKMKIFTFIPIFVIDATMDIKVLDLQKKQF